MIGVPRNDTSEWHMWVNEKQVTYFSSHTTKPTVVIRFTDHATLTIEFDNDEAKRSLIERLVKRSKDEQGY